MRSRDVGAVENEYWERQLAKHSLSERQIAKQGIQHRTIASRAECVNDPRWTPAWKGLFQSQGFDWEDGANCRKVPIHYDFRAVPDWTRSDKTIKRLIDWKHPHWREEGSRDRRDAGRTLRTIYMAWRLMSSNGEIAEALNIRESSVELKLGRLSKLGANLDTPRKRAGGRQSFSYEEALRLRESGMTYAEVGERLRADQGVVGNAVRNMKKKAANCLSEPRSEVL